MLKGKFGFTQGVSESQYGVDQNHRPAVPVDTYHKSRVCCRQLHPECPRVCEWAVPTKVCSFTFHLVIHLCLQEGWKTQALCFFPPDIVFWDSQAPLFSAPAAAPAEDACQVFQVAHGQVCMLRCTKAGADILEKSISTLGSSLASPSVWKGYSQGRLEPS